MNFFSCLFLCWLTPIIATNSLYSGESMSVLWTDIELKSSSKTKLISQNGDYTFSLEYAFEPTTSVSMFIRHRDGSRLYRNRWEISQSFPNAYHHPSQPQNNWWDGFTLNIPQLPLEFPNMDNLDFNDDPNLKSAIPFLSTLENLSDGRVTIRNCRQIQMAHRCRVIAELVSNSPYDMPKRLILDNDGILGVYTDASPPMLLGFVLGFSDICDESRIVESFKEQGIDPLQSMRDMQRSLAVMDRLVMQDSALARGTFIFEDVSPPLFQTLGGMAHPLLGAAAGIFFNIFDTHGGAGRELTWLVEAILGRVEEMIHQAALERELRDAERKLQEMCTSIRRHGVFASGLDLWLDDWEITFFNHACIYTAVEKECRTWQNTGSVLYALQFSTLFHAIQMERIRTANSQNDPQSVVNQANRMLTMVVPLHRQRLRASMDQYETHRLTDQIELRDLYLSVAPSANGGAFNINMPLSVDHAIPHTARHENHLHRIYDKAHPWCMRNEVFDRVYDGYRIISQHDGSGMRLYCTRGRTRCTTRMNELAAEFHRCQQKYISDIKRPIARLKELVYLFGSERPYVPMSFGQRMDVNAAHYTIAAIRREQQGL
jgi:hypothetical protein